VEDFSYAKGVVKSIASSVSVTFLRIDLVYTRSHVPGLGFRVFCLPNDRPSLRSLACKCPHGACVAWQMLVRDVA